MEPSRKHENGAPDEMPAPGRAEGALATNAFLRGVAALALAALAEGLIRRGDYSGKGGLLYLAAIALFAYRAWPRRDLPARETRAPGGRAVILLAAGALFSAGAAVEVVRRLVANAPERPTIALWIASFGLLLLASLLARRATAFAPRWSTAWLPESRGGRAAVLALLAAILVLGAVARLKGLGSVPFGINPDEGDQAAVAQQIVRGVTVPPFFGFGWYHLNMIYFHLLAAGMRVAGLGVAGARVFGALCGIGTLAVVTLLALRHFGRRAGLVTACLLAVVGPALQFSRIVTVAGPTALLWSLSALLFLEAARAGAAWAWVGAGVAGGMSIYFYPTGRLWPVIAAVFCVAVFVRAKGARGRVAAGTAVAALAAFVTMGPFFHRMWVEPGAFTLRARETTIFIKENPLRLPYYKKEWSTPRLVWAQIDRSLGIFDKYEDANGVFPNGGPILPPAIAALVLLGLGAAILRAKDERLLLLSLWFVFGFLGVVVTVETPNLHRMSTAVPVLPLLAALVLDDVARRAEEAPLLSPRARRTAALAACGAVVALLMAEQLRAYFVVYAKKDPWVAWRTEGGAVAEHGKDAVALAVSDSWFMVHSGWVRLLAPEAQRGGVPFPARDLPLQVPANRALAFVVYPNQVFYLGFLADVYPGGTRREYKQPTGAPVVDVYRIERERIAALQGALLRAGSAPPVRVDSLGDAPAGATGPFRWTAAFSATENGNATFRVEGTRARLLVDGTEVAGANGPESTVSLAEGEHFLVLEASSASRVSLRENDGAWEAIRTSRLLARERPRGLAGTLDPHGRWRPIERLDKTIATSSLHQEVRDDGALSARWSGTLAAPRAGAYAFSLVLLGGRARLAIDGAAVVEGADGEPSGTRELAAGPHEVELSYEILHGPGKIEWTWTPPGGEKSIVPPSVLAPPPGRGVAPPLPPDVVAVRPRRTGSEVVKVVP